MTRRSQSFKIASYFSTGVLVMSMLLSGLGLSGLTNVVYGQTEATQETPAETVEVQEATQTPAFSPTPTVAVSETATEEPTQDPSTIPTDPGSEEPTQEATQEPTAVPTEVMEPTVQPTVVPTESVTPAVGSEDQATPVVDGGTNLAQVLGEEVNAKIMGTDIEALDNRLNQEGAVRVIVGLNVDYQMDAALSVEAAQNQRAVIASRQAEVSTLIGARQEQKIRTYEHIPYMAMTVDKRALAALLRSGQVVSVKEDQVFSPALQESTALVGADDVWALGATGSGQTVAVVDTGVEKAHTFLSGKVVSEACYSNSGLCPGSNPNQSTDADSGEPCTGLTNCDHGTHIAGIIAGNGDSASPSQTYSGVAKGANLISIMVASDIVGIARAYESDVIAALERVYALRSTYTIAAVNVSLYNESTPWGEPGDCDDSIFASGALKIAINDLRSVGIVTVFPTGNSTSGSGGSTTSIYYPACLSSVVAVGASTDSDQMWSQSFASGQLDLFAPGVGITSSVPGGSYASKDGTSAAAAHVSGAFAVLRETNPTATVDEILTAMNNASAPDVTISTGLTRKRLAVDVAWANLVSAPTGTATGYSPQGSIANFSPSYSWSPVSAATSYMLVVTNSDTAAQALNTEYTAATAGCASGTCTVTPASALPSGRYYWTVQAKNPGGSGPVSVALNFQTPLVPDVPVQGSPSGLIDTTLPTYSWGEVTGDSAATMYQLYVDGPSGHVFDTWYDSTVVCSSGTCSVTPENTLVSGAHQWYVRGYNVVGNGAWSSAMDFTVPSPPGVPTLLSPSGNLEPADGSDPLYTPVYEWTRVADATSYRLYINGPTGVFEDTTVSANDAGCDVSGNCSWQPEKVLREGNYIWYVRATRSGIGVGAWSTAKSFTLIPPTVEVTNLISPESSGTPIDTVTPTYVWYREYTASYYYLSVTPQGSTTPSYGVWYADWSVCNESTCAATPTTALEAGATFDWTIQTYNSTSGAGPVSSSLTFTTPGPPGAATLTSPNTELSNRTPTFVWQSVDSPNVATQYQLYVAGPSGTAVNTWYQATNVCSGGSCTATPSVSLASGSHRWYIRTYNTAGYGPWSTLMEFSVPNPPGAPTLVSPSGNLEPATPSDPLYNPTFEWSQVANATDYRLYVRNSTGVIVDTTITATQAGCDSSGPCTWDPGITLNEGDHTWYVQSQRDGIGVGAWSTAATFRLIPPQAGAATLVSPENRITNYQPTYSWGTVETATYYHLVVTNTDTSGVYINAWYRSSVVCSSGTCETTPAVTLAPGHYSWKVQTYNLRGYGLYSTDMIFETPLPPTITNQGAPSGLIDTRLPTYSWADASEPNTANWYNLLVVGPSGTVINSWHKTVDVCASGTCSVTPEVSLVSGSHTWYIRGYNSAGYGAWKIPGTSFTVPSPPGAATLTAPTGTLQPTDPADPLYTPTYYWDPVADATDYRLYINGPSGNIYDNWITASDAGCEVSGPCNWQPEMIMSEGDYVWWVRTSRTGIGDGAWSTGLAFRWDAAAPAAPTLGSPQSTVGSPIAEIAPVYSWSQVDHAAYYILVVKTEAGAVVSSTWYTSAAAGCTSSTCEVQGAALSRSTTYKWTVQTWNYYGSTGSGEYGGTSAEAFFTTPSVPGVATLVSPQGTSDKRLPEYQWTAVGDPGAATWYRLYSIGPSGAVVNQWYQAGSVCVGNTCTVQSTTMHYGGNHTWYIQAYNAAGTGSWTSPGATFTVPKATPNSPSGAASTSPTFNWQRVGDATNYRLYVSGPSGVVHDFVYTNYAAGCGTSGPCSKQPALTLGHGTYSFYVLDQGSYGNGEWAGPMVFYPTATLQSPSGYTTNTNPIYQWTHLTDATWYQLSIDGPSGNLHSNWYSYATAGCDDSVCEVFPNLPLDYENYSWKVRSWNAASGYGEWTSPKNFSVYPDN